VRLERDTALQFIEYLKAHGYPDSSIALEYRIGEKYRVDIAILDPINNIPIQLFEIKSRKSSETVHMGIEQLQRYRSVAKNPGIPGYLVFSIDEEPYFEVLNIDKISNQNLVANSENMLFGLNYSAQRVSRIAEEATIIKKEKEDTVDSFKWTCWSTAIVIFILGVLSKFKVLTLNATDLTILGAIIALILVPYSSKLKILGVEFERLTGENKRKGA
jgi:hypothetical protein